jgi:hypothetical protein
MSSGHLKYETKPLAETLQVIGEGDTGVLRARKVHVETNYDWPYVGGTSVSGRTVFLDRRFVADLKSGKIKVPGLTADQVMQCLIEHEQTEKCIEDGDNPIDNYPAAHEYATTQEHELVKKFGGNPDSYEAALRKPITNCLNRTAYNPPKDAWCGPIIDEPDDRDKEILKQLRRCAVTDSFKRSKVDVHYGVGQQVCKECKMFEEPGKKLSTCAAVSGLVRDNRYCVLWEQKK